MLPKPLETCLEDSHRHPVIEVNTTAPSLIPFTMIELDVIVTEFLVCPILVPAARPPAMSRGELNTELVVLFLTWSPLDLEIAIGTAAEIGAVNPRGDHRRSKRT